MSIIPNVAMHLNREVNKGFEYNAQNHLCAIIQAAVKGKKNRTLKDVIAAELKVKAEQIGECDLFLYDPSPAVKFGADNEFIISGRLDNLAMSHAILAAISESTAGDNTPVAVFYDSEEIGSSTPQGADSAFTTDILTRICIALKLYREQEIIALRKSFLISADMAHAVHPNFADKHDSAYQPQLNHGPVIKMNSSQRYATTSESSARFESLCEIAGVPCQKVVGRSDLVSGMTIGPITGSKLGIPTVDIGNPMWAMHSIRETMGTHDHDFIIKALFEFFKNV